MSKTNEQILAEHDIWEFDTDTRERMYAALEAARQDAIAECVRRLRESAPTDMNVSDYYNAGWLDAADWLEEEMKK